MQFKFLYRSISLHWFGHGSYPAFACEETAQNMVAERALDRRNIGFSPYRFCLGFRRQRP